MSQCHTLPSLGTPLLQQPLLELHRSSFLRRCLLPAELISIFRRSSRSKRKQERKVGSGRKGTVDEEEYLVKSIAKLVGRFTTCRSMSLACQIVHILTKLLDEARTLIPHLFQFTAEHRTEGLALQEEIGTFERRLSDTVNEVWKKPTEGPDGSDEPRDSWAARMEQAEKAKRLNPIDSVPKPDLDGKAEWRLRLLDFES
jgi:elongator complex protein 1